MALDTPCRHPVFRDVTPQKKQCLYCGVFQYPEVDSEYGLYGHAIDIVAGANMASEEELANAALSVESLIGTGYYDDAEGKYSSATDRRVPAR